MLLQVCDTPQPPNAHLFPKLNFFRTLTSIFLTLSTSVPQARYHRPGPTLGGPTLGGPTREVAAARGGGGKAQSLPWPQPPAVTGALAKLQPPAVFLTGWVTPPSVSPARLSPPWATPGRRRQLPAARGHGGPVRRARPLASSRGQPPPRPALSRGLANASARPTNEEPLGLLAPPRAA